MPMDKVAGAVESCRDMAPAELAPQDESVYGLEDIGGPELEGT